MAGSQLSNFPSRTSAAWLLLDSVRLAEPRDDLGGLIVPSFGGGEMVLLYGGPEPDLEIWNNDLGVEEIPGTMKVLGRSPGRLELMLSPDTPLFIRTDRPATDFTLVPKAHEHDYAQLVWYPALVEKVARGAVLRAPHIQQTNWWYGDDAEMVYDWAGRPTAETKLQSGQYGIAIELLADLANRAETDLWLCVPGRLDDDTIRQWAKVVDDSLGNDRRLFVEVGNEVWNAIPPYEVQRRWMTAEADRRDMAQGLDEYARGQVMHAIRTAEIGEIVEDLLGDDRVVVVLGQQVGMAYFHDLAAERLGERRGDIEALAIAPYFGHSAGELLGESSDAEVLEAIDKSLDETLEDIRISAASAERHGWPLIAYEGGQHLVPPGGWDATDAARLQMKRLNESEAMGDLYRRWLTGWSNAGGGLMMHYGLIHQQDGRWGAWGLYETTNQPRPAKADALEAWTAPDTAKSFPTP